MEKKKKRVGYRSNENRPDGWRNSNEGSTNRSSAAVDSPRVTDIIMRDVVFDDITNTRVVTDRNRFVRRRKIKTCPSR